jgi:hypothetical protein
VIKISHWELDKMRRDMPEVVGELRKQIAARKG